MNFISLFQKLLNTEERERKVTCNFCFVNIYPVFGYFQCLLSRIFLLINIRIKVIPPFPFLPKICQIFWAVCNLEIIHLSYLGSFWQ